MADQHHEEDNEQDGSLSVSAQLFYRLALPLTEQYIRLRAVVNRIRRPVVPELLGEHVAAARVCRAAPEQCVHTKAGARR